jgi:hypothetical protein
MKIWMHHPVMMGGSLESPPLGWILPVPFLHREHAFIKVSAPLTLAE